MSSKLAALLLLFSTPFWAQVKFGAPVTTTTALLTVVATGTGTGSITSADGGISACAVGGGGTCTHTYNIGQTVTLNVTPTGGSTTSWSSGTDGASSCSGSGSCVFIITSAASISGVFTAAGGSAIQASPYFAIDYNNSTQFPTGINHGQARVWDTPNLTHTFMETCTNGTNVCAAGATTIDYTKIDAWLALLNSNAVHSAQYALARTPVFASSSPSDTNCNYYVNPPTKPSQQPGQCDPYSDTAADGTGTDLYFKNFVGAITQHVNAAGYLNTHAHIVTWEVWNEPSVTKFWKGSFDQLIRMQEDAYFIIKGDAGFTFTLTSVNTTGVYQGTVTNGGTNYYIGKHFNVTGFVNGANNVTNAVCTASTATSLTLTATTVNETHAGTMRIVNTFTGETAAQVQASVTSVTLAGPTDTTASVVMPSYFGQGIGLTQLQQWMYCTPATTNCHNNGGRVFTDQINIHMKPGGNYPTIAEAVLDTWISAVAGVLTAFDTSKPKINSEGGYAAGGWVIPFDNVDMQASYMGRTYTYEFWKGISNNVWYDWTPSQNGLGSTNANTAYTEIYNWMVGSTFGTCTLTGDGVHSPNSLYTCTLTLSNGISAQIMWNVDATFNCTTACPTQNQTVPGPMLTYVQLEDLNQTKNTIGSHLVPIGIVPVLVQAQ